MMVGQFARKRSRCFIYKWREVIGMTNVELLCVLISIASLAFTIYFGLRR